MVLAVAAVGAVAVFSGSAGASTQPAAGTARVTTVATGLDNPRGLSFSASGRLYVAEAGHGGAHCSADKSTCIGLTSAISQINIAARTSKRVVTGLVSVAGSDGSAATGLDGISIRGTTIYGIETGASTTVPRGGFPARLLSAARHQLGRLIVANTTGQWHTAGNVGDRDYAWSRNHKNLVPGQFPDANPYGVLALAGTRWVVDAGANTLDRVTASGQVRVVRFIPNPPTSDAVPTCLARGRDGALYIGELTGAGNTPGSSVVWRYAPAPNKLTKWATGLTAVTGCGFDHRGRFYATEFSTLGLENATPGTGALVRVAAHSTTPTVIATGLNFPGGFAAGPGGALYVSNWSIATAHGTTGTPTGSVIQIRPKH